MVINRAVGLSSPFLKPAHSPVRKASAENPGNSTQEEEILPRSAKTTASLAFPMVICALLGRPSRLYHIIWDS